MRDLALALEKIARNEGVEVTFNANVEQILEKEGKASGLKVNGEDHTFDHIVSGADYSKLIKVSLSGLGIPVSGTTITKAEIMGKISAQYSPYYISNNLIIPCGEKLEIEAGTSFIFTGPYTLTVGKDARFIAHGTKSDSILFTTLSRKRCSISK